MASSSGIQLCLLNNDPTSTLLMTPEGQPLYSIATPVERSKPDDTPTDSPNIPSSPNQSTDSIHPVARSQTHRRKALTSRTTINRLDHSNVSSGHVETTVGIITYPNSTPGFDSREEPEVALDLCEQKCVLTIEAAPFAPDLNQTARVEGRERASVTEGRPRHDDETESSDEEWVLITEKTTSKTLQKSKVHESSWDFIGPDNKHYKWQLLVHSPVLTVIDKKMVVPLARYRRAKLGIISRPRKGFLEILPVGCPMMDLIVSTFVTFMKHWVLPLDIVEEASESIVSVISNCNESSPGGSVAALDAPPARSHSSPPPSYVPSRFHTAASLARKHSVTPPTKTPGLPPYARGAPLEPPSIVEINQTT